MTATDLRLASPERAFSSKRSEGSWERWVLLREPSWVTVIFGPKGRVEQLTAMKGELKLRAVPWSPIPSETVWNSEQLVGLIMKFGRSIVTVTCRSRSGMPWMIVGSGSDFTVTCASLRST